MSDTEIPPKPIPDPAPQPIATPAPPPPPPPKAAPPKPTKPAPPAAKKKSGGSIMPLIGLVAFLVLAAGELYLYKLHLAQQDDSAQIAALQSQIATIQQTATQSQPAPTSPAAQSANTQSQANLNEKFDALTAQVAAMQNQLATDHGTITTIQADSTDLTSLTAKITLLNRLESARIALDSGQPLGDIPGAPPALAKFATTAPPTQAQLQLAFPAAAAAANNASVDKQDRGSVWQQALARVENLVTISNGSHVIIGAPAAAITTQAQQLLDAGDLAGAVATLTNGLSPTTQAALGNWLPQAESLLAARAAIVTLADQK
jgi:hypothetical protein